LNLLKTKVKNVQPIVSARGVNSTPLVMVGQQGALAEDAAHDYLANNAGEPGERRG
jgi:hypothetical protein